MVLNFGYPVCHSTIKVWGRTEAHRHNLGLDLVWIRHFIFPVPQFPQL